MSTNRGFTLIELLIVVAIISILASMAMPIISIAQRAAKKTATRSVMHKLDTALNLFKADAHAYPYQRTYANILAGERPTNRLFYHLGTTLSASDVLKLHQDAAAAALQYAYPCGSGIGEPIEQAPVSQHVFVSTDVKPAPSTTGNTPAWVLRDMGGGVWAWQPNLGIAPSTRIATCALLNRMAAERARLAIWSGNVDVVGCRLLDAMHPDGGIFMAGRDNSGDELLAVKRTGDKPGWGSDYLAGELESRYIDGDVILDAWRRPIIYVCQLIEGMRGARGGVLQNNPLWIDARIYGLGKQGRGSLRPVDPISGEVISADGVYLPDPTDLMNSDRRRWAAPGMEYSFELWSSGPDGGFEWMRPHQSNLDNVALEPYDHGIIP
jgi:prepilin-type N-terminal cleavage/methylation domain-containing protein